MRILLLALMLTTSGTALAPALASGLAPSATCDAPAPFASHSFREPQAAKVSRGHAAPDTDPEATLRSALHLCVIPARGGRATRAPTYRA